MSNGWLVFVESNTSGTGRTFARTAARLGFRPVLLAAEPQRYAFAAEDELEVLKVDTGRPEAILQVCERLNNELRVAGITSSSEYFIESSAIVARLLGLPGPSVESVRVCRDKWEQRKCLQNAGVGVPAFRHASSTEKAVAAADELGLPVIVKPVSGSGSVGVNLCADLEEVGAHAGSLLSRRTNERGLPIAPSILVEEVAVGPEYSVESFGSEVVGVTKKHLGPLPHFVETGHDYPAILPPEDEAAIRATASAALAALEVQWGPSHSELRLTAHGPRVIEVNPRLAGGYIPELVRLAHGIDLICETIRVSTGIEARLENTASRFASLRFVVSPEDGILMAVHRVEDARLVPGVESVQIYVRPGQAVKACGDFRSRVGHVIASADDSAPATLAAELAHQMISLQLGNSSGSSPGERDGKHRPPIGLFVPDGSPHPVRGDGRRKHRDRPGTHV